MKPYKPFDLDEELRNEGEGSRSAARRYQAKVKSFVDEGRVDAAARDAASAVDGPEGPELRAAEEAGKAPAYTGRLQRLKGMARAFVSGAKAAYDEAKRK